MYPTHWLKHYRAIVEGILWMWEKNYTYSIGVVREYLVNILADSLKIPEDKNSFSHVRENQ